jgi:hypothetical protein
VVEKLGPVESADRQMSEALNRTRCRARNAQGWRSGKKDSQLRTIPKRKGVKIMKYTKPVITASAEAIRVIQSSSKVHPQVPDNIIDELPQSMSAYEADE